MLGTVIGDIVGSPYEFDANNIKTTEFPLFSGRSRFTDDTVMTVAVADALMRSKDEGQSREDAFIQSYQAFGRRYPDAGYGARFRRWLTLRDPRPYGSYGNGSAMRVSPVAWFYDTLEEVETVAAESSRVTHDHPEGIRGAVSTASAIFLARSGASKDEIERHIVDVYGYDLSRTLDEIRPTYHHVESCQETVPQAMCAFLQSDGFEDALRKAVSLGGDSDTLAAICCGIAEAYYGIPDDIASEARGLLDETLLSVIDAWYERLADRYAKAGRASR